MENVANAALILLMVFCAVGYFIAGLAMLVMRPARIDGQTGEPTTLWRAMTYMMFVMSIVNVASSYVVKEHQTESWWLIAGRVWMATALLYVLLALWRRRNNT
jgi:hypothetical protein